MKEIILLLCLTGSFAYAQKPAAAPEFDPEKSGVKVVFAPERRLATRRPVAKSSVNPAKAAATGEWLKSESAVVARIGKDGKLRIACEPLSNESKSKKEAANDR